MATQFEIDCALMAGRAYQTNRAASGINWFPVPAGWMEYWHVPNDTQPTSSGFEMSAFQNLSNPSDIVISFAGTEPKSLSDWEANVGLATGFGSNQLLQAAEYYMQVKAANPDANITFTGHSLGGGLAALMGVFFGKPAITFDQAPFANSAELSLLHPDIASNLKSDLLAQGYNDADLAGLTSFIDARQTAGGIPNANLISTFRVAGEFTSSLFPVSAFDPIGAQTMLTHGQADWLGESFDLHAQSLLTAFMQSDFTAPAEQSLSDVTYKLTDLLKMMFDNDLFAYPTDKNNDKNVNFLENLVRHESGMGIELPADQMVTRFTSDMWKIAQDGGLTLTDNNISKALIAFAMQKYYEEKVANPGAGQELFARVIGGIQFDIASVSEKFNTAFKNSQKLNLSDAKGYKLYFRDYLNSAFTSSERRLIQSVLPYMRDWYVQADAIGMDAADTLNLGAFMLGGSGSDALTGGTSADLLVGNAGDDTLTGGHGNDFLLGGAGNDTYVYSSGDGQDTILDSDGIGSIVEDGVTLSGGVQYGDNRVHRSADGHHLYVTVQPGGLFGSDTLVIDGNLIVQQFDAGELGINFTGPTADVNPFGGDDLIEAGARKAAGCPKIGRGMRNLKPRRASVIYLRNMQVSEQTAYCRAA